MYLLEVAMCEKCRSSHFQSEGGVKSLRTWGVKKFQDWGVIDLQGVTFAGRGQYPITSHVSNCTKNSLTGILLGHQCKCLQKLEERFYIYLEEFTVPLSMFFNCSPHYLIPNGNQDTPLNGILPLNIFPLRQSNKHITPNQTRLQYGKHKYIYRKSSHKKVRKIFENFETVDYFKIFIWALKSEDTFHPLKGRATSVSKLGNIL